MLQLYKMLNKCNLIMLKFKRDLAFLNNIILQMLLNSVNNGLALIIKIIT
jgi:hypothetical protein